MGTGPLRVPSFYRPGPHFVVSGGGGGLGPRGTLGPPTTLPGLVAQGAEVTLQAVAVGVGGLHPGHSGSVVPVVQGSWDT